MDITPWRFHVTLYTLTSEPGAFISVTYPDNVRYELYRIKIKVHCTALNVVPLAVLGVTNTLVTIRFPAFKLV